MVDENGFEDDSSEVIIQETYDSVSSNYYSDIVNAILLIPATLISICFFVCIYRIFINRRLR